ncbi:MAG: efflux RND transporter periplasmic adaptor subunit [Melioribacter sp.]|nr:efflux RND transporter periplasmic adaptor subunit [Melioribacter sp.]
MKKKYFIYGIIAVALIVTAFLVFSGGDSEESKFNFVEVKKGKITNTITSTGTLEALSTVEVGTQVSGRIANLYVDFNDEVRKGQLLALIDTTLLSAQVRDQQAVLERTKAQYNEALAKHERNKRLYEKKFISELDFITSQTQIETALASLKSAEFAIEKAKTNLEYAFITAPISGKIINRNVEQGQTVAASLSAPTLFTMVEDLSSMRILANVDESDIGQIKIGQRVQFTVQSFQDKKFEGEVSQIRLSPQTIQNVVNYTVVVRAENKEKLLLPGMTATVDFYVAEKDDVLILPNIAMRFTPPDEMMAEFTKRMEEQIKNMPDSLKNRGMGMGFGEMGSGSGNGGGMNFMRGNQQGGRNRNFGRVWYLDDDGKLSMGMVFLGISDGKNSEIVRSRNIKEGMKLITGIVEPDTKTSSTNPLNPTQQNRAPGFGRGF